MTQKLPSCWLVFIVVEGIMNFARGWGEVGQSSTDLSSGEPCKIRISSWVQ